MSAPDGSPNGQDPEEEITPDDSVSNVSKTSSACASTTSKAYLKAASRRAKTEAEIAFLKKKVDLELSMVDLEAEERIEEAQKEAEHVEREAEKAAKEAEKAKKQAERERMKAERARRRRRAEIDLQQVNAFSKLEEIWAQEQMIFEMMSRVVPSVECDGKAIYLPIRQVSLWHYIMHWSILTPDVKRPERPDNCTYTT